MKNRSLRLAVATTSAGQAVAGGQLLLSAPTEAAPAVTQSASSSRLSSSVDAFVKKWKGRYADYDRAYGAQCVDLFNYYNRDVVRASRPPVSYAYQLWDRYDSRKYTRVGASSTPRKGDVAVWSKNLPYSGGGGHVAIVLGTSGKSLVALTQNPGATKVATLSKGHLRGYLRPKV